MFKHQNCLLRNKVPKLGEIRGIVLFCCMVQLEGMVECFDGKLWGYYVVVSGVEVEALVAGGNRRVNCTINGKITIPCALMPRQDDFFILLNKEVRKKLGLRLGERLQLQLESDTSPYGMPMPEELGELLAQDEEGSALFHALLPGKQRNLIYLVGKVKNPDGRIRKALAVVEHLKDFNGQIDFKALGETIKRYNRL